MDGWIDRMRKNHLMLLSLYITIHRVEILQGVKSGKNIKYIGGRKQISVSDNLVDLAFCK
jgi:hypothetical protein